MPKPCAPVSKPCRAPRVEAAQSLGFSRRQRLWSVQLPLALRYALPALVNNMVDLVKMTTVASPQSPSATSRMHRS